MAPQGENPALGSSRPEPMAGSGRRSELSSPSQIAPPYSDFEWREEGSAAGAAAKSPFSAAKLFGGFKRRWRSAIAFGLLLGGLAGVATWYLAPSQYTIYALLEVPGEEQTIIPEKGRTSSVQDRAYQNSQAAIIKSRPVIQAALRRPEVRDLFLVKAIPDPVNWLEDSLTASFIENTDLLKVSIMSPVHAKELAVLVNGITEAYMNEVGNGQRNQKLELLNELQKAIIKTTGEIRDQQEEITKLANTLKQSDSTVLNATQKNLLEHFAILYKEYGATQSKIRDTKSRVAVQKNSYETLMDPKTPIAAATIEQELEKDTQIMQKNSEVFRAEEDANRRENAYAPGSPLTSKSESNAEIQKKQLQELRKRRWPVAEATVRKRMLSDLAVRIREDEQNAKIYEDESKEMKVQLDKLGEEANRLGLASYELVLRRKEVEAKEKMLSSLQEQEQRVRVEVAANRHRVTVIQRAEAPETLPRKRQMATTALSGFSFFFLGLLGIAFREVRERKITTANDVAHDLGLRVVGVFPSMTKRVRSSRRLKFAPEGDFWDTILNESIDSIRTMLMSGEGGESPQVVMVTSAMPREGKTTLATQLATSVARTGRKTLLIDFDLRHPMIHEIFDVPKGPGLSDVLLGRADAAQAIQTTPLLPGLFILTAGQSARQVVPMLSQGRIPAFLKTLRSQYDYIVVDSSPVLPVADALLVGQHVDGVVFSIRPHFSQHPSVEAAYERLRAMRIKVVGAVVNGVPATISPYEYRYLSSSTS